MSTLHYIGRVLARFPRSEVRRPLLCVGLLLVTGAILGTTIAIASTQSELDSFLNEWEIQLRTTSPGFYQGQQRGFITGGAADIRFPSRHIVPLTLSLPSARAGCGGISFFGGAFSYINSEQFTQFLQNIAQNAVGVAFDMALRTLCPQCATVLANMEGIVRSMTGSLGNSCQAAKALGKWAASTDTIREIAHNNCKEINQTLGLTTDTWGAAIKCPNLPEQKNADKEQAVWDALNPTKQPQRLSQNIFWSAYDKLQGLNPFWDTDHGQYLMSLLGTTTINYKPDDPAAEPEVEHPGHTVQVGHLLGGWNAGEVKILSCGGDALNCLTVTTVDAQAFPGGFEQKVEDKLTEYATRLEGRTRSNPEPILQVNVAGIPIARLLTMVSGMPGGKEHVISISKRIIAVSILRDLVNSTIRLVRQETKRVKNLGPSEDYLQRLDQRKRDINQFFAQYTRDLADGSAHLQAIAKLAREAQEQGSPALMGNLGFAARFFHGLTAR